MGYGMTSGLFNQSTTIFISKNAYLIVEPVPARGEVRLISHIGGSAIIQHLSQEQTAELSMALSWAYTRVCAAPDVSVEGAGDELPATP